MKNSFYMHGYSVALVKRDDSPAYEVVIRAPYTDVDWTDESKLKLSISQLERELEVRRAALDLVVTKRLMATEEHAVA